MARPVAAVAGAEGAVRVPASAVREATGVLAQFGLSVIRARK